MNKNVENVEFANIANALAVKLWQIRDKAQYWTSDYRMDSNTTLAEALVRIRIPITKLRYVSDYDINKSIARYARHSIADLVAMGYNDYYDELTPSFKLAEIM